MFQSFCGVQLLSDFTSVSIKNKQLFLQPFFFLKDMLKFLLFPSVFLACVTFSVIYFVSFAVNQFISSAFSRILEEFYESA